MAVKTIASHQRSGNRISAVDLLITTAAVLAEAWPVTRNTRDFSRVPDLVVLGLLKHANRTGGEERARSGQLRLERVNGSRKKNPERRWPNLATLQVPDGFGMKITCG